jgi:hypothetical protein
VTDPTATLTKRDLQHLRNKLPGLLSATMEDVNALIAQAPDECARLLAAFERLTEDPVDPDKLRAGARQWLGHTMTSVPLEHLRKEPLGTVHVEPTGDASLLYLLMPDMPDQQAVCSQQVRNREVVCRALFDQLTPEEQARYGAIAAWSVDLGLSDTYTLAGDVSIAKAVVRLQRKFAEHFGVLEEQLRGRLALRLDSPTPPRFIPELADQTYEDLRIWLIAKVAEHEPEVGETVEAFADNLVVRVLSNIAANRILLESAKHAELFNAANTVCARMLNALNGKGITHVPEVDSDEAIKTCLLDLFGRKGRLENTSAFMRALSESDAAVAVARAAELQDVYRRGRGAVAVKRYPEAFNDPKDRLCIAMALAACFGSSTPVGQELEASRSYAVFPARGGPSREAPLSQHAQDFVLAMYGQIALSNDGWELSAYRLRQYAEGMTHKRGRTMQLIFDVFKRWPAGSLVTVQDVLVAPPQRDAER